MTTLATRIPGAATRGITEAPEPCIVTPETDVKVGDVVWEGHLGRWKRVKSGGNLGLSFGETMRLGPFNSPVSHHQAHWLVRTKASLR